LNVVEYLLNNGASLDAMNTNRGNQKPVHICSIIPNREAIARLFQQRGADFNSRTTSNGAQTPLELAVR
jgi:ankyrin repeat protein